MVKKRKLKNVFPVSVALDEETLALLDKVAEYEGRSRSQVLRRLIQKEIQNVKKENECTQST